MTFMKRLTALSTGAVLMTALASTALADGDFTASATAASCAIGAGGTFATSGTGLKLLSVNVDPSGSGGILEIRPSIATGLFNQAKVDTSVPSASSDVGIEICVTVDGGGAGVLPKSCVVYDQQFQQISSQLFSQISTCFSTLTATACTIDSDCAFLGAGFICNNPTGAAGAGKCASGPDPLCNVDLISSALSAHSFDFVIAVDPKKPHVVEASWKVIGAGNSSGNASALTCVGPGIVTVTQHKLSGALLTF